MHGVSNKRLYLRAKLRKLGWRRFGAVASRCLGQFMCRKDHYFLFQRPSEPFHLPKLSALRAVPITVDNLQTFSGTFPYRPEIFLRRLSRGLRGFFYLKENDVPMAYHWYAVGQDYYEPVYRWTFRLGEHEAYIFDGYVLPERRGSITTAQALAYTVNTARERGAETVFSVTDENNAASWKLHLHLGFEIVGCLEVLRLCSQPVGARQVDFGQYVRPEMHAAMDHYARKKSWPFV